MVTRSVERGELPPNTDAQLVLDLVRILVDSRGSAGRLDKTWLSVAVRTVLAGARAGTLTQATRAAATSARRAREAAKKSR